MLKNKKSQKIKALLFDLGKVIVDFDFTPAFQALSKYSSLKPKEIREAFSNSGLEVLYDGGKISSLQFHYEVKKMLRHNLSFDKFKKIWNQIFTLNPETARIIRNAKEHTRLVLVSNTNAMHFDYIRVKYSPLKHFDRFILSYREKVRKPDARIYQKAALACRAKPHEILYIDDREDLTQAADALGFHTFTYKKNTKELLKKMKSLGFPC